MSVDSKLFVATKIENLIHVMPKVIEKLNEWQRGLLKEEYKKRGYHYVFQMVDDDELWSNGVNIHTYNFTSFSITFGIGERRHVFVTHTCSCDYSDTYKGDKIIFSVGTWGRYDEIMKTIAEALKEFGAVYYDFNDCDDQDFVKLN